MNNNDTVPKGFAYTILVLLGVLVIFMGVFLFFSANQVLNSSVLTTTQSSSATTTFVSTPNLPTTEFSNELELSSLTQTELAIIDVVSSYIAREIRDINQMLREFDTLERTIRNDIGNEFDIIVLSRLYSSLYSILERNLELGNMLSSNAFVGLINELINEGITESDLSTGFIQYMSVFGDYSSLTLDTIRAIRELNDEWLVHIFDMQRNANPLVDNVNWIFTTRLLNDIDNVRSIVYEQINFYNNYLNVFIPLLLNNSENNNMFSKMQNNEISVDIYLNLDILDTPFNNQLMNVLNGRFNLFVGEMRGLGIFVERLFIHEVRWSENSSYEDEINLLIDFTYIQSGGNSDRHKALLGNYGINSLIIAGLGAPSGYIALDDIAVDFFWSRADVFYISTNALGTEIVLT